MAGKGRGVSFSDLKTNFDHNELSESEVLQNILNEEAILAGSNSVESKNRNRNAFDWDPEEENMENLSMGMFESNMMGIKQHDYEIAHEFLKHSRAETELQDVSHEALMTKQETLDGYSFGASEISIAKPIVSARSKSSFSEPKNQPQLVKVDHFEKPTAKLQSSEPQDLSDFVNEKPQISAREFNALKQKLRESKSTIEELKSEKWKVVTPENMIKRVVLGKSYSLEHYKSLKDKLELLDCSLKTGDGNAINAVLVFLQHSLKQDILLLQLKKRPKALNHYVKYLEINAELKTEMDIFSKIGKKEDAFILNYRHISGIKDPNTKLHEIDRLLSKFRNSQEVADISSYIEEERSLLQRQIQIEKEDEVLEKQGKNLVMRYQQPRSNSVVMKSLLTTLYYCTLYHFEKPSSPHHPLKIKTEFKLNEKQYEWTVIPACAKLHRWSGISEILTNTNWLRKKTERSYIGFEHVSRILQNAGAPSAVVEKYVRMIENADQKLKMATFCRCHNVAIDTIIYLKDKQKLEKYRQNVIYDERLRSRITNCLNDPNMKWR